MYTQTLLHTDPFTQTLLHTDPFIHRPFYTQTLLHTDALTHRPFHTQTLLHTDAFTHRRFYTQTLLHTGAFTHRPFYTQTLFHTDPFTHKRFHTHRRFYTRTFLHTTAFTHRSFYTQTLLHTDPFTHRPFYTQTLLHTDAFTHRCLHTRLKSQFYLSFWHSNLVLCVKGSSGTLEIAILPQFLTLEPRFVRKGWRFHSARLKSQFYLSVWHLDLVLCVKGSSGTLEIAILPQFLTLEPRFVRKGCNRQLKVAILPQFLTLEPRFVREGFIRHTWNRNFTSVFDTRTSFRAKGLTFPLGTLEIAILPQFLTLEPRFVRKGWRFHSARLKSQFYLSVWHSDLVLCVKGSSGTLEIAILPQFLTLEPRFVRKGCNRQLKVAILPQFLTLEPRFVREGFIRTSWNRNFTSVFDTRTSFRARGLTFRDPSSALPAA